MSLSNKCFRKSLALVAVLVGAAILLGAPTRAHAAFELTIMDNQGDSITLSSSTSVVNSYSTIVSTTGTANLTMGVVYLGGLGTSASNFFQVTNFGGTSTSNSIDLSSANVYDDSASSGKTITFVLSGSGFSTVGPGVTLTSEATEQVVTGTGAGSTTYQSYINSLGTVYTSAPGPSGTLYTSGLQGPQTLPPSWDNIATTTINPFSSANYSLTSVTTWSPTVMGTELSIDNSSAVSPVPSPTGLVLFTSAMPLLSLGYWLRRRQACPAMIV